MNYIISKFFSQSQAKKIYILEYIFIKKIVSIEEVCAIINGNKKRIYDLTNLLMDEVIEIAGKEIFTYKNGFFKVDKEISDHEWHFVTSCLKDQYLNGSIMFRIFQLLLKKSMINVVQLSTDLNVSQSYLYKNLKKIEKSIAEVGIKAWVKKKNGECKLVGNELQIRFIYYYLELFKRSSRINNHYNIKAEILKQITFDRIKKKRSPYYRGKPLL